MFRQTKEWINTWATTQTNFSIGWMKASYCATRVWVEGDSGYTNPWQLYPCATPTPPTSPRFCIKREQASLPQPDIIFMSSRNSATERRRRDHFVRFVFSRNLHCSRRERWEKTSEQQSIQVTICIKRLGFCHCNVLAVSLQIKHWSCEVICGPISHVKETKTRTEDCIMHDTSQETKAAGVSASSVNCEFKFAKFKRYYSKRLFTTPLASHIFQWGISWTGEAPLAIE